MPNDIAHFAIHADDCPRAKAFYETVFGWTFEPWGPPNFWVTAMYATGGTTSLYTDCAIERCHRDIHAAMQHVVIQPLWLEEAGRVRFGLEATNPLYAV